MGAPVTNQVTDQVTNPATDPKIIDGKVFAAAMRDRVAAAAADLTGAHNIVPGLAVVLVGDDPASQVYVRAKTRAAEQIGFIATDHRLPATATQAELQDIVARLNDSPAVHGILIQLPLPGHLDPRPLLAALNPVKDVDGLTAVNTRRLAAGETSGADAAVIPCTPLGVMLLLRNRLGDLTGMDAVIVGRSNLVGKPLIQLLLHDNCTVTTTHSRTRDLAAHCRRADILIAAVGRPEFIQGDWVNPGATVIDVGVNRLPAPRPDKPDATRLVGDVAFADALPHVAAITPVPGGVGPMTVTCLLSNTLAAAHLQNGLARPDIGAL